MLEPLGSPNLGLMPDLFHMNIEDAGARPGLEQHAGRIGVHPLRGLEPAGARPGHTDFRAVLASLKRAGYDGWVGVEILPRPDPDTAAREAIQFLRPLVEEYKRA